MCLTWLHTQDLGRERTGWGFLVGFFFHVCCLKGWELNSCTVSRNRFLLVWLYLELQSEDLRV